MNHQHRPDSAMPFKHLVIFLSALFCFALVASTAEAQDSPINFPRHSTYVELLGPTSIYSLNYEYRPTGRLALRVGATAAPTTFYRDSSIYGVVAGGSYLIGSGSHHLELGGTLTTAYAEYRSQNLFRAGKEYSGHSLNVSPVIGYRYERPRSGFLFRAVITPIVRLSGMRLPGVPVGAGLSFGWGF